MKKLLPTIVSNSMRVAAVMVAIATGTASVAAQDNGSDGNVARPVKSIFTADVGTVAMQDTYLSPITYKGTNLRLGYQHMQALGHDPERWVRSLDVGMEYDNVHNIAGNNTMHGLYIDARWALMRRWRDVIVPGLQLMGGGAAMMHGGVIYNPRNSNNICSVKVHAGIGIAGCAAYPVKIGKLPVTLCYQMSAPVIGAFYSPDYDESYYEIYVGNHSGLAHVAWPGSRLEINNLVSADLHLGSTILRLGYRHHGMSSGINNLTTRHSSHALVIGLGGDFLSVGAKNPPARTVTAF